ncbi:MAG: hypothetical protein Kow0062_23560 [Acidobacteriota bacterium]
MSRTTAIVAGAIVGALLGALFLWVAITGFGAEPRTSPAGASPDTEATERMPAREPAPAPPAEEADEQAPLVETRPVTIYRRAATETLALVPSLGQIVWFGSPADRGRQIAQLVVSGVPGARRGAVPAPRGVGVRDVLLDPDGTMWVDLEPGSLSVIAGSDTEQALVACLARSLVEGLDEVRRVGIVVDGEPRRTLAGHVDLSRTFTGREWPLASELGQETVAAAEAP